MLNTITCGQLCEMKFPPIAPEPAEVPTWDEMVAIEPRLAALADDVRTGLSMTQVMVQGRLQRLVGRYAEHPALRSSEVYAVVYKHLAGIARRRREADGPHALNP